MVLKRNRVLAFILCLLLAVACLSVPMTLQSNEIKAAAPSFSITASPSSLSGAGSVQLSFKVTNNEASQITNCKVTKAGTLIASISPASIAAGGTGTGSANYNVPANQLDNPIDFRFEYTLGGSTKSVISTVKVSKGGDAKMTVVSEPASTNLEGTNKTTINYTVTNSGSTAFTNVKLTDPDIAGNKVLGTVDSLAAGASKNFSYEATLTRTSSTEPVVTGVSGGKTLSFTGAKKTITLGAASTESTTTETTETTDEDQLIDAANGISLTVSADKDQLDKAQKITLTLEIHNLLKDQGYKDITIIDKATKKELTKIDALAADETKTLESEVEVKETTSFIYTVTATADDGTKLELDSNELKVTVGGNRNTSFLFYLIIFGVVLLLLIGVGITLFVLSRKHKKKKAAGTPYSNKYKNKIDTPDDTVTLEGEAAPLSTFSIEDEAGDSTMPINIPQQSSNFTTSDYDDMSRPGEEPHYDPNTPIEEVMGQQDDETRPLKKTFQTIDYDDLDPDKQ